MTAPSQIVSPNIYGLILSSPHLREKILPEGIRVSPYEVLNYDGSLVLHDKRGTRATFKRRQRIRFLQDGVSAIMDHAWGDGIILTNYRHSGGVLADSFKDQGVRHLVVDLKRPMKRGEILDFEVEREAMEMFGASDGWVETRIDHPISKLSQRIVFPKGRPAHQVGLDDPDQALPLTARQLPDGSTEMIVGLREPAENTPYVIRWRW